MMERQMMDIFNVYTLDNSQVTIETEIDYNDLRPKIGQFYMNNSSENVNNSSEIIMYNEIEPNVTDATIETRYNELPPNISSTFLSNTDSVTESSPTPPPSNGPSLGDIFFYMLFAYCMFNVIEKYLNRGRRRANSLLREPPVIIDKTEEELNDHLVTKMVVSCSLSTKIDENDKIIEADNQMDDDKIDNDNKIEKLDGNIVNMEEGNTESSTISQDELSLSFGDEKTCAICIDTFEVGDEVSWSRYHKCDHVFHYECIIPWLKRHDECPYCRCNYIMPDLEKTVIAEDFIYCAAHGLVECGQGCNEELGIKCCNSMESEIRSNKSMESEIQFSYSLEPAICPSNSTDFVPIEEEIV